MTKRSDLRSAFGDPSQDKPLYLHNAQRTNMHVRSLGANALKSPGKICAYCNNTRSQPHDRAWERLSKALRSKERPIMPGNVVRADRIFECGASKEMLNVHLFFVKLFGCHIAGNDLPFDIAEFSSAILQDKAHPRIYLSFGCGDTFAGLPRTGMSDLLCDISTSDGYATLAKWRYAVDGLVVEVTYANVTGNVGTILDLWHPRNGTGKLTIADYSQPS